MIDVAEVRIWGEFVGAVAWNADSGYASFEYDRGFLKRGYDLAPLTMPIRRALDGHTIFEFPDLRFITYSGLPGMLADSLPDRYGTELVNRWLAEQGRSPGSITPVERLCYTGKRGMGALEYEPPLKMFESEAKSIELDKLVRLASQVIADRDKLRTNMSELDKDGLNDIIRVGTSAGGARAKAVIAYNKISGDIRSGQTDNLNGYDYWIIKLDGVTNKQLGDPEGYGKIEYAYYFMAGDCGINMTECDLKYENKRAHFMTRRFDREGGEKIHMQTLCGLAHFDYNQPLSYSYEQAFQVIRQLNLPYPDSEELFRRMCFNVVARNQDDHTKNISFLMDKKGVWRLSPAYDITFAYNPERKWTRRHQMSINEKRDDITREDILSLASNMNIKKPGEILDRIIETISRWPEYAKNTDVDPDKIRAINKTLILDI